MGPLFFSIYINDLPSVIPYTVSNKNSSIVLFADDMNVIISEPYIMNFERKLNIVFQIMKEWFSSKFLSLIIIIIIIYLLTAIGLSPGGSSYFTRTQI